MSTSKKRKSEYRKMKAAFEWRVLGQYGSRLVEGKPQKTKDFNERVDVTPPFASVTNNMRSFGT